MNVHQLAIWLEIEPILNDDNLFNKSKLYLVKADKWNDYTSLLAKCKCLLAPYYTREEKINALTIEHQLFKNNSIEDSISYAEPILNDDTVPLYQYTIQVMLNPSIFDIDITTLTINELNQLVWQLVVYSPLSTIGNYFLIAFPNCCADISERVLLEYTNENIDEYNINLVSFEDVFLGNWASIEFKLDKQEFNNAMIEWDKRNTKYLNKIGVKPKRGIKRFNQELY